MILKYIRLVSLQMVHINLKSKISIVVIDAPFKDLRAVRIDWIAIIRPNRLFSLVS